MSKPVASKIIEGLKDALAVARGEQQPYRVHTVAVQPKSRIARSDFDGTDDNWVSNLPNPPCKP